MIKPVIAAAGAVALSMSPLAAFAGPYVNVENNAGWSGDDYTGAVTDLHVGFEGDLGDDGAWYIQGGPALVQVDGEENDTEVSGKVGASFAVTDQLGIYGEVSAITQDQEITDGLNLGTKIGAKFNF